MYCILSFVHINWNKMKKKNSTLSKQLERIALLVYLYDLRTQLTIQSTDKATVWHRKRHYIYLWYYIFTNITIHCLHVHFWICYICQICVPVCFQHSHYFANVGIARPFCKENKRIHEGLVVCSLHLSCSVNIDDT